jgi:hypothetical protein
VRGRIGISPALYLYYCNDILKRGARLCLQNAIVQVT